MWFFDFCHHHSLDRLVNFLLLFSFLSLFLISHQVFFNKKELILHKFEHKNKCCGVFCSNKCCGIFRSLSLLSEFVFCCSFSDGIEVRNFCVCVFVFFETWRLGTAYHWRGSRRQCTRWFRWRGRRASESKVILFHNLLSFFLPHPYHIDAFKNKILSSRQGSMKL